MILCGFVVKFDNETHCFLETGSDPGFAQYEDGQSLYTYCKANKKTLKETHITEIISVQLNTTLPTCKLVQFLNICYDIFSFFTSRVIRQSLQFCLHQDTDGTCWVMLKCHIQDII